MVNHTKRLYGPNPTLILDAPNFSNDPISQTLDWNTKNILSIGLGTDVYCYDVDDGCSNFLTSSNGMITSLHSIIGGQKIFVSSNEGCITSFDLSTLSPLEVEEEEDGKNGIKIMKSNHQNLFLAIPKKGISIRDFRLKEINLIPKIDDITSMDIKDEKISITQQNSVSIYDIRKIDDELFYKEMIETPNNITFSPTKRGHIAWGSGDGCVSIMDYRTEALLYLLKPLKGASKTSGLFWCKDDSDSLIESHGKSVSLCKNGETQTITEQFIHSPTKMISLDSNRFVTSAPDDVIKFFQIYK